MTRILVLLLAGCGTNGKGHDSHAPDVDADSDGYAADDDCDDARPAIHPGATEITADGIDQDCDGLDRCYRDDDGDSYGQEELIDAPSCGGSGAAGNADDCDDADSSIFPGAIDPCDENVDANCDGSVAFVDGDGDGSAACVDCDDLDALTHPGALEVVDDQLDQDCDGGDACYADADGDGYGTTDIVSSEDLDCLDEGESVRSDDCLDEGAGAEVTWPGAAALESTDCMTDADGDGYGSDSPGVGVTPGSDCDDTDPLVTCPTASFHVGNDVEFPDGSSHGANFLLGTALEIPTAMTVTHLAVIGKGGGSKVRMALYDDDAGAPGTLVAETDGTPLVAGILEMPVLAPASVAAGPYWIMGIYDHSAAIGIDTAKIGVVVKYISMSYADPMPSPFGGAHEYTGQRFNYYLVGY